MKKLMIFMFLGFMSINMSIFTMEDKQGSNHNDMQLKFSKKEVAKISAASLGCAWLVLAALRSYAAKCMANSNKFDDVKSVVLNIPSIASAAPFGIIAVNIFKIKSANLRHNIIFSLGAISSLALASKLGFYIHKKLSQLKANKLSEPKKVV